ncbi:MAG: hypothetical protein IT376_05710 [Polyangiaceae bacterium]|nr:hypothetical protein [Polyangiaceae bacterium]
MLRSKLAALVVAGGLAASALVVRDAAARAEAEVRYTKAQAYSAALRYLRVDLGVEVTERDPDAAYLLFKYSVPGKATPTSGAIEVVEVRDRVKLVVQLPKLPTYHEQAMRDGLLKKLAAEYGEPPRDAEPPEKPPERSPEKPERPPKKR